MASIMLKAPAINEQLEILRLSFSSLPEEVIAGALTTLRVCRIVGGAPVADVPGSGLSKGFDGLAEIAVTEAALLPSELANSFGRHFSLRDLFKLCARLQACPHFNIQSSVTKITNFPFLSIWILQCKLDYSDITPPFSLLLPILIYRSYAMS